MTDDKYISMIVKVWMNSKQESFNS